MALVSWPSLALMCDNSTVQTVSDFIGTDWRVPALELQVR